jgi:hypothetical protein
VVEKFDRNLTWDLRIGVPNGSEFAVGRASSTRLGGDQAALDPRLPPGAFTAAAASLTTCSKTITYSA